MTAAIRIPTHTTPARDPFAADLSLSARAGLTSGLSLGVDPAVAAELAYRRESLQRRRARRRDFDGDPEEGGGKPRARRTGTVSRWISWLPSVPRHRSSGATAS
jgi:hypothetical protein